LGACRDRDDLDERREPKRLDANRPHAIGEIGELVKALLIGDGHQSLVALRRGDRRARNGQSAERHLTVVLGCRKGRRHADRRANHTDQDDTKISKKCPSCLRDLSDFRQRSSLLSAPLPGAPPWPAGPPGGGTPPRPRAAARAAQSTVAGWS